MMSTLPGCHTHAARPPAWCLHWCGMARMDVVPDCRPATLVACSCLDRRRITSVGRWMGRSLQGAPLLMQPHSQGRTGAGDVAGTYGYSR
eukprot:9903981-Alexandrium_andersonii.AAC.1